MARPARADREKAGGRFGGADHALGGQSTDVGVRIHAGDLCYDRQAQRGTGIEECGADLSVLDGLDESRKERVPLVLHARIVFQDGAEGEKSTITRGDAEPVIAQLARQVPVAFKSREVFEIVDSAGDPITVAQLFGIGETRFGVVASTHGPAGDEEDGGGPVEGGGLQIGPANVSGEVDGAQAFFEALRQFKIVSVDAAGIGGGLHLKCCVALSPGDLDGAQVGVVGLLVIAPLKGRPPGCIFPKACPNGGSRALPIRGRERSGG